MKKFVLGIIALACISAQAEYTPEGKTIKVVLPQGPSSGMAMIYRHIENYAAKNKINMVPVFKPGAESLWPYDESKVNEEPTKECYIDAANRKVVNYKRLNKISDVVEVIGLGKPVIIGADVFDDFDFLGPDNTEIHLPGEGASPDGSHAMCIVGYSIPNFHFIVKNSYGNSWGDQGYCTMPFEYFNKYVYESWCFDIQLPYTMNRVIWS